MAFIIGVLPEQAALLIRSIQWTKIAARARMLTDLETVVLKVVSDHLLDENEFSTVTEALAYTTRHAFRGFDHVQGTFYICPIAQHALTRPTAVLNHRCEVVLSRMEASSQTLCEYAM